MTRRLLAFGIVGALLVTALVTTEARTFAGPGYTAASSPAAATPVASPAATPAAVTGNAYESPTFGWHLTWDDDVWSVEDEWSRGGTDRFRLGTGTSSVHFSAYRAHDGDAARCIEQPIAFRPTQPGTTDVTVVEGPTGDAARTWLVQTFVFTEEQGGRDWEIREYAECRSLVPGEAVLVIDFLAVADEYDDHFPLLEELLAGIVLPSQADRAETATVPVGWRDVVDRGTSG